MSRYVFDLESNGLLNHTTVDYLSLPYKLKPSYKIHCAVFKDIDTKEVFKFTPTDIEGLPAFLQGASMLIGHNIIDFDLLVFKLYFGIDYEVDYKDYHKCRVGGNQCAIVDTLILSQYLSPDRLGGHGLKAWGKRLGNDKGDYGEQEDAWEEYSEEMLEYNVQDVELNEDVYYALMEEWGDWDHLAAFSLEQSINEVIVRQKHIGFWFDVDKAEAAVEDLTKKMRDIEHSVEPNLPKIKLAKTNAAKYALPARQVKKDGTLTTYIEKFADKHSGELYQDDYGDWHIKVFGKDILLPCDNKEPLVTQAPMQLSNQKQMKEYLVYLGWEPIEWNDRDLTLKSGTKLKVDFGKYKEAVVRYCQETSSSHFKKHRLDFLKCRTVQDAYDKLMHQNMDRPVKVITAPKYTIDQEKTICPNLERLGDKASWVKDVVLWLTYRHRKNSIKSANGTGFLTHPRLEVDGRIPTDAQVTGTNTYRFKHRFVANIPRVSSIYGGELRDLFGCDPSMKQIGCDASGLEARVQGHYCIPYTGGEALAELLVAEKPNDVHSVRARDLGISRDAAKAVGYACLPTDNTEVLTEQGWKRHEDISVGDVVLSYNEDKDVLEKDTVAHTHFYRDAEVYAIENSRYRMESTANHRWYAKRRVARKPKTTVFKHEWRTTDNLNTECSILNAAPYLEGTSEVTPDEAAMVAWILSDGTYKWAKDTRKTSSSNGKRRGLVVNISQDKSKFWREVEDVIEDNNLEYVRDERRNTMYYWRFKNKQMREFFDRVVGFRGGKQDARWLTWVLELSPESREAFLYHFWLADGCTKGHTFSQSVLTYTQNKGVLADMLELAGNLQGWRVTKNAKGRDNDRCQQLFLCKNRYSGMQRTKVNYSRNTDVFCLTMTNNSSFVIRQGDKVTITGNCMYGAQPAKLRKMLGVPLPEAKRIHTEFWESMPSMLELKARVEKYWMKTGKKFIKGVDGRKIFTRSQHSLLNALFQSAGSIIVKLAAILVDRELQSRGILFKPFDDDSWEGKAAEIIHYQDEYQFQVCPSLIDGDRSDVGDIMAESMIIAGKYLNMKVEFPGEYDIGMTWKDCH